MINEVIKGGNMDIRIQDGGVFAMARLLKSSTMLPLFGEWKRVMENCKSEKMYFGDVRQLLS